MNIAQALRKAAEMRERVSTQEARLISDFVVGGRAKKKPVYTNTQYEKAIKELGDLRFRLQRLKCAIRVANEQVVNGSSVAALLGERQFRSDEIKFLTSLRSSPEHSLDDDGEPRILLANLDKEIDLATAKRRRIDDEIADRNASIKVDVKDIL